MSTVTAAAVTAAAVYETLTPRQRTVLDAFVDWRTISSFARLRQEFTVVKGYQRSYVSWSFDTPSGTAGVIEALAKKGLFTVTERMDPRHNRMARVFTLTPAALEFFTGKAEALREERRERDLASQDRNRRESARARAALEATRTLLAKYEAEYAELRDALEAQYLAQ